MIEIKNLNKTYKGSNKKALDNINLKVESGDIFAIIGFSGAGKSSLLRCINRLEDVQSGEILIDGKDILKLNDSQLKKERKKIGMIFQNFNLFNEKTVFENIAFPLKTNKEKKYSKEYIDEKVTKLLELVDLKDKKFQYPKNLSGGQKQRVAIARSMANDSKILLLDEFTSALDNKTTNKILELIKKINREIKTTMVLVTHEMDVVKKVANKVAIIDKGKIIEQGDVYKVFTKKVTPVTKPFIEYDFKLPEKIERDNLVVLTFLGENAKTGLISKVSRKYNVDLSILAGDVSYIEDKLLGKLLIKIPKDFNIDQIKDEFEKNNVKVGEYGEYNE